MFYFGVDYYPEHWPEERWPVDAQMMADAGMNIVRLAEFAWSRLEPDNGEFEFEWLERAIGILANKGIKVILGTPTASPPPWLMQLNQDFYRVNSDGRRLTFGNRREYCPNHPDYREYSRRIVTQLAQHFAQNPSVVGWQIDNEFGERCYCQICRKSFQAWLKRKYSSLDELNEKWGTVFWSHVFNEWHEIPIPISTGGSPNPGLALDYYRFASDSYVEFQKIQVDIIRSLCPGHFITHNFMGFGYEGINYFDLAKDLDLVAWDNYPRNQWNNPPMPVLSSTALSHDTMRGLKSKNFWVMEQQSGPGGWEMVSLSPRPGELRLWAYQGVAHGADGLIFFRWRTARFGTEEYWHGLLDHDGNPGRRYDEIQKMGSEIKKIGEVILGSEFKPSVAMILSYDSRFAFQIQANNPQFSYASLFHSYYRSFYKKNILVDILQVDDDLQPYKLVVAPALHVLNPSRIQSLRGYVENGGVLAITHRSGVKDETNMVVDSRLPGILAGLCGTTVEEYDSLGPEMSNEVEFFLPKGGGMQRLAVKTWCDILKPMNATVVARYVNDYYAGKPAITCNRFGKGWVVYIGTAGDEPFFDNLANYLIALSEVKPVLESPEGVEITERWVSDRRLLFVLNYTSKQQEVSFDGHYSDILLGSRQMRKVMIAPYEFRVFVKDKSTAELRYE